MSLLQTLMSLTKEVLKLKQPNDLYPGAIFSSLNYGDFEIVEYSSAKEVLIRFKSTGYESVVRAQHVRLGKVKDYILPSVFGIGYYGSSEIAERSQCPARARWLSVMQRCYDETQLEPAYYTANICTQWHSFTSFENWIVKQPGFNMKGWELDKDLLIRGNTLYSPETCVFLPKKINTALIRCDKQRGKFPVGVSQNKTGRKFEAWCGDGVRSRYLGVFETVEEAFLCYKLKKEDTLKGFAEEYKELLDPRAYSALLNYQVNITD